MTTDLNTVKTLLAFVRYQSTIGNIDKETTYNLYKQIAYGYMIHKADREYAITQAKEYGFDITKPFPTS